MKKTKKLLLTVFLTLCFVLCFGAFAACDGNDDPFDPDNAVTYTVTVNKDSAPVSDVTVAIHKGSSRLISEKTDANGKATFELVPDSYTVKLSTLPVHYEVSANANLSLTKDSHDLTVSLTMMSGYTVKLVDTNGDPYYAADVTVAGCEIGGSCKSASMLGTDGIAILPYTIYPLGEYHVKIVGLPDGMGYDRDAEDYYTGAGADSNLTATRTELTITIRPE
ncbi:MAG: Ig-like domain-containing protein [Clostridia bacterium]|nr:Ig-like domain-containing protein [Clostridia bacterium]